MTGKPPHCIECGRFLKRKPVQGLGMGRFCVEHGLALVEDEPKLSVLMNAFLSLHREREHLMKRVMKQRIR